MAGLAPHVGLELRHEVPVVATVAQSQQEVVEQPAGRASQEVERHEATGTNNAFELRPSARQHEHIVDAVRPVGVVERCSEQGPWLRLELRSSEVNVARSETFNGGQPREFAAE